MKTIEHNLKNEQIVQKSRFITLLIRVHNKEEVRKAISDAKEEYPAATHYTYAYVLDIDMHASDDGEPSGTAGNPMLNVLIKQKLTLSLSHRHSLFWWHETRCWRIGSGPTLEVYETPLRKHRSLN